MTATLCRGKEPRYDYDDDDLLDITGVQAELKYSITERMCCLYTSARVSLF